MTDSPAAERSPAQRAPRLPLVPKEHGASFMSVHALLLGVVAGFAAGGRDLPGLLLALGMGALFLPLAGAVSVITHPRQGAAAKRRAVILGAAMAAGAVLALVHGPARELVILGAAGVLIGGLYGSSRWRTGARSIPTQLAAIAGITILAPLAWLLIAGATDRWQLASPVALLSFGGTVPYVRERVRRRKACATTTGGRLREGAVAVAWQVVAVALAIAAAAGGTVGWLVPVAFLPGATKVVVAIARPETRPPIKRIGYLETGISTAFAILAGLGLGLPP